MESQKFNFEIEHNGILWEVETSVRYFLDNEEGDYLNPSWSDLDIVGYEIESINGWNIDLEINVEFDGQDGVISAISDYIMDKFELS